PLGMGAYADRMVTDLGPQFARETGEPLDLAIVGEGFFAVQTEQGVRYTRNGQFTASPTGQLVDQLGNPVLGAGGGPIQLTADGHVAPGAVGVFAVADPVKQGDNLFAGAEEVV